MRRTDRLFEIMQLFRGGRLLLGRDIAEKLEVSLRTIYRDIETLIGSGVPIEGERGVGYILREPIFLPPLTLIYNSLADGTTQRHIRPIHTEYWGKVWTCIAWCELRHAFRAFRIDRIQDCQETDAYFHNKDGMTYTDYLAQLSYQDKPT